MSNLSGLSAAALTPPASPVASATSTTSASGQTLTQQDFLKIMVSQFTQQDPFSGGSSGGGGGSSTSDYVTQLMNMTNLTTMQTMSSQMTKSTQQQAMLIAQTLPGSTVNVNANGTAFQGLVQKTRVSGADVYLTVGGQEFNSTDIISINQTAAQSATTATPTTTP